MRLPQRDTKTVTGTPYFIPIAIDWSVDVFLSQRLLASREKVSRTDATKIFPAQAIGAVEKNVIGDVQLTLVQGTPASIYDGQHSGSDTMICVIHGPRSAIFKPSSFAKHAVCKGGGNSAI